MQPVIVIEANEIPPRLLEDFACDHPRSTLARMLRAGTFLRTVAGDVPENLLYPSQTWASMNMGVPFGRHRIHWYNDAKPAEYPHYAELLAAAALEVAAYGSLHSAALARIGASGHLAFFMPDSYDAASRALPAALEELHRLDVALVRDNGRASDPASILRRLPRLTAAVLARGLRASTVAYGAGQALGILAGRLTRERLRNLHFALHADVFLRLLHARPLPAVTTFFTNHVAANMHRYWFARYPGDYASEGAYETAWVQRYRAEIGEAMGLLDGFLARVTAIGDARDAVVVVCSSMGQAANKQLDTSAAAAVICKDPGLLMEALVPGTVAQMESAMIPQYTLRFATDAQAGAFEASLLRSLETAPELRIESERSGSALTLTLTVTPRADTITIAGRPYALAQVGLAHVPVDDHHSGAHSPVGTLLIHNSRTATRIAPSCDYLEFAPAMLRHFGVPRPAYMREPTFAI